MKIVLVCSLLLIAAHSTHPPITSKSISALIERKGASKALDEIYNSETLWPEVLHRIATGSRSWLKIAKQLRAVSDAGASEQLELAVGEALEHQPENVLRFAVPAFSLEVVCSGPDVDDPRFDSYELSIHAINLRQAKLREIATPNLRHLRNQCIEQLETSKAGIGTFYGKTKRPPNSG